MSTAPLVQLDTGGKYYKTVIDGMAVNFKKAVAKACEKTFNASSTTTGAQKPITVVAGNQQVTVQDIQIEGIHNPKVSNVYVNKKNLKLHVVFNHKTIRLTGRCSASSQSPQKPSTSASANANKLLLEATNWSTAWSANVMPMIGREHFDMNKVYSSHTQQRLSLNLKECPQNMHDKIKAALVERINSVVDKRLVEIMETVMMHTETLSEPEPAAATVSSSSQPFQSPLASFLSLASSRPNLRGKRASSSASKISARRAAPAGAQPDSTKTSGALRREPSGGAQKQTAVNKSAAKIASNTKGFSRRPAPPFTNQPTKTRQMTPVKTSSKGAPQRQQKGKALKRTKRQTPCQPGEELDDYVDQLFRFGTRIVRAMEPITLPNATVELPDYNLKIFLYEGKGTRAYKFRRTKPAWVFCSNETISLGITIEVEELRVAYKYRVISGNRLLFDGDLEARLSPRVQAQFSQKVQEEDSEEPVQQRIDRVRVFRLGRVQVLIRGLGNLTQSLSMLINGYLNDNQEELQPTFRMVEGDAVRFLNRALANVNVPLLSVV